MKCNDFQNALKSVHFPENKEHTVPEKCNSSNQWNHYGLWYTLIPGIVVVLGLIIWSQFWNHDNIYEFSKNQSTEEKSNMAASSDGLLLHKNYSEEVIEADPSCKLLFENVKAMIEYKELEGIYILNCSNDVIVKLAHTSENMIYKVTEPGTFMVFSQNKTGEFVNLSEYVTVEYEIQECSEISEL
ncbi:MAG: hypothetical protein K2M46_08975 [Lachnospiraceae bacterium]|nr:hypothetical protein [Lachnospiraceae bacterium]